MKINEKHSVKPEWMKSNSNQKPEWPTPAALSAYPIHHEQNSFTQ